MANTDEKLRALEAWLSNLYKDAESEMRGKWDEYLSRQEKRAETLLSRVREAKTDEERKAAEAKYQAFLRSKTFGEKYYQDMVRELASQYADVNSRALRMVNGQRAEFFADGYNFSADEINAVAIRQDIGIRFDLCDADTVEWLAEHRERTLMPPPEKLKIPEDERWSAKLINSQVSQGIIQGESIPKIAKRLENVTDGETKACIRRARTMVTGAENAGRVQAMKRAESWGVKTRKRWLCTHDSRTRDSHLEIDGETVEENATFSNGCRWPGDTIGPPAEVWNCRCTLITVVDGFSSNLPKGKEDAVHVTIDGEEVRGNLQNTLAQPITPNKELRKATTRQEAYDILQKDIGFHEVSKSMRYIDDDVVTAVTDQLNSLNSRFGVIGESYTGYISAERSKDAAAWVPGNFTAPDNQNLVLSFDEYGKGIDHLRNSELTAIRGGWNMPADSQYAGVYTVTHEYGHMLENKIINSRVDMDEYDEKRHSIPVDRNALKKTVALTTKTAEDAAKKIFAEITDIAKEADPDFSLRENISKYGRSNYREAFAEAFANSQLGEPNALGRAMNTWLERNGY